MNVNFAKRAAIVVGAAALSVTVVAGTAQADPPAGVHRTLVAVGSDTTQDVLNGLGNAILDPDPGPSSDGQLIASYDATGGKITTRDSGCATLDRPDGSGAGVIALNNDITSGAHCFDFARSSSAPNASGVLTFIPFAKDAVTVAVHSGSNIGGDVTLDDLKHAYNCQDSAGNPLGSGVFPTINGVTVHPLVPQNGSGTRKFWASTLGFDPTPAGLPSCVKDIAADGSQVQEHNGNALQRVPGTSGGVPTAEDIMPFSIAQYIAQGNGIAGVTDRRGPAVLDSIGGVSPTVGGNLNTGFPITRDVYNVIPDASVPQQLIQDTFVGPNSSICTATDGGVSVVTKYGFGSLGSACGVISAANQHRSLV